MDDDLDAYRRPGELIDSDHPRIVDYARRVAGEGSPREQALRLYYAVRDDVRYDPRPGTFQFPHTPDLAAGDRMECDLFPRVWPPAR